MTKRSWGGEFAVGLTAGGALVLVILTFWYGPICNPNYPCGYPIEQVIKSGSFWYDTAAQWLAASTGVAVALFTFWTILLVRKTLAADDAALHEAKEQTKIARSVGERQTRAYLGVIDEKIVEPDGKGIQFVFRNSGQSIALNVNTCISWSTVASNFAIAGQNENSLQNSAGSLHPGQTVRVTIDTNSPVEGSGQTANFFQEIKDLAKDGYVFGYATYIDSFGVTHKTSLARTVSFTEGEFRIHFTEHGNDAD